MTNNEILAKLKEEFPGAILEVPNLIDFTVAIEPDYLVDVATFLRDEAKLDYLSDVTAVDRPGRFEVVYHLYSIAEETSQVFVLKVYLEDKENPSVASITTLWQGAYYQECEIYDLMGIHFEGHPNLKRILLWEGFEGHPLRKDYENRLFTYEELKPTNPESD